jgi:hypothetical protein
VLVGRESAGLDVYLIERNQAHLCMLAEARPSRCATWLRVKLNYWGVRQKFTADCTVLKEPTTDRYMLNAEQPSR